MRNLKAFLRILAKASRERGMTATQLSKIASTPIAVVKELLDYGTKKGFFSKNIEHHQLVYTLTKAGSDFANYVRGYQEIFVK